MAENWNIPHRKWGINETVSFKRKKVTLTIFRNFHKINYSSSKSLSPDGR